MDRPVCLTCCGLACRAVLWPWYLALLALPATGGDPVTGPQWPPFDALQAQLEAWQRAYPRLCRLEILGQTAQGRPVSAVCLTDTLVDDADKEHVLLTALHSGIERSGATGLFAFMEWLLSADPLAQEILRRQVVVCLPVANPDGYVIGSHTNSLGQHQYNGWTPNGPPSPEKNPEGVAVQQLMDRYQPEVHADFHGIDLSFPGYIMTENSGGSWSNLALRPYHSRIMELMDAAAEAEGFPSEKLEQDAERAFWGPDLDSISGKLWDGRPHYYAALYCYDHYHSLTLASEILWERSGVLRHRRLLQVGNETWPGEYYPGYPTRVIAKNEFHSVVAYGQNAAARRRSRVELWAKAGQITQGIANPQTEGLLLYLCATSPEAARKWLAAPTLVEFVAGLASRPGVDAAVVRQDLAGYPDGPGQWGAAANLALQGGGTAPGAASPLEHGISMRLRLPYPRAQVQTLRLNGHPIALSETNGYLLWSARGNTYIQVNVPPERSRIDELFVVTCRYDPGADRPHWQPRLQR
jgi:hypothetical protein